MQQFKIPKKQRYLSAKQYLKDVEKNQVTNNIEQVTFIPPTIGKGGFGKFLVKYKRPVLVNR